MKNVGLVSQSKTLICQQEILFLFLPRESRFLQTYM